ncbi:MAG: aminotransferase class V-fold PLP-dependent enzyme [Erysipelotrichales bacterium]|nr:aminotransferase class V-fold PLP-dependent enzyme [Erysipelotrichales bacterium]
MSLIYFDNAATSRIKPDEVYDAFNYFVKEIGVSPSRGSYGLAIDASRMLYKSRKTIMEFFGGTNPNNVVFTKNSTEAINLFLNGFLMKGDHVIISPYEHNAVLRPIHNLSLTKRINYSIINEADLYSDDLSDLDKYISNKTKLVAITLASNLTGQIVFSKRIAEYFNNKGIKVFVDSSQGGGKRLIDISKDNIDYLAFTGHKDLFGLPGVGGLCTKNELVIPPLIQGGTGIFGDSYINPETYPDGYEAGTLNMPAIWALKSGIDYILRNGEQIKVTEEKLMERLLGGLKNVKRVKVYNENYNRVPTLCFNIENKNSSEVVEILNEKEICTRGGIHCSILAHKTIGTDKIGAVRVSLNHFNNFNEIDAFLEVIERIR